MRPSLPLNSYEYAKPGRTSGREQVVSKLLAPSSPVCYVEDMSVWVRLRLAQRVFGHTLAVALPLAHRATGMKVYSKLSAEIGKRAEGYTVGSAMLIHPVVEGVWAPSLATSQIDTDSTQVGQFPAPFWLYFPDIEF